MGEILNKRLKQKKFESTEQEALLNIFVASNHLKSKIEGASSTVGITSSQYNVLRILKGKYPDDDVIQFQNSQLKYYSV